MLFNIKQSYLVYWSRYCFSVNKFQYMIASRYGGADKKGLQKTASDDSVLYITSNKILRKGKYDI